MLWLSVMSNCHQRDTELTVQVLCHILCIYQEKRCTNDFQPKNNYFNNKEWNHWSVSLKGCHSSSSNIFTDCSLFELKFCLMKSCTKCWFSEWILFNALYLCLSLNEIYFMSNTMEYPGLRRPDVPSIINKHNSK